MRAIAFSPNDSGPPPVLILPSIVSVLVLIITWATPAASFAVSFSLGDELVTIGQNFTGVLLRRVRGFSAGHDGSRGAYGLCGTAQWSIFGLR